MPAYARLRPQTLVSDVLPYALQKCGDDESVDSRVVAATALGSLAGRLEKETVERSFLARALAMCQARPRKRPPAPRRSSAAAVATHRSRN